MTWQTRLLFACACWSVGGGVSPAQEAGRGALPNVVLIITDDMGSADLSSYGATDIRTPRIDSLARDGVRMTAFYANAPVCTPTRAGLISGRYQQRYGLEEPMPSAGRPGGDVGLPGSPYSLPNLLAQRGYVTALVGKWHLGYRAEFSPRAHGFGSFFGLKSGYHDFYAHTGGDGKPDLWEDDRPVVMEGYTTDLITDRAVRFLEDHASRRFFLEIAYNAPHWPYQPPGRPSVAIDNARHVRPWDEATGTRADYVAMVEQVDRGVGRVLDTLERLRLAPDTIVIFTNDNGGEWLADNRPFFNRKSSVWEGGIRVPALIRWPGRIPAGTVSPQVGITMDLSATIVAATGGAAPAEARYEGLDLLPMLRGTVAPVTRTLFWRTAVGGRSQVAVRSGDWKLMLDGNNAFVFDVRADPGERQDLTRQRQDVARRLRALVAAWEADVDAEWKASGVNPRGAAGAVVH
ncbi:N-acetylgalactosamine-6-sulfatase [Luteitalea sp. TBR-22]|uniref:sulfatase-like hydrolase/transferase n=1 Tax=Luteitalea sp. TBR-22 TaxID=2802971 RepID=UPI001AFA2CF7|nr:sulfatase-like hydrolase/transferase [Luteitalea sp. TBR-22]BCS34990.1 N-acetylgalactosamine-6-sulfatase [Luteitalea sp. TBR-22]